MNFEFPVWVTAAVMGIEGHLSEAPALAAAWDVLSENAKAHVRFCWANMLMDESEAAGLLEPPVRTKGTPAELPFGCIRDPATKSAHGLAHHRLECNCDVCYPPPILPERVDALPE